nr:MAG TPA: hypothetical protein [Caudoviricetes sp.]
MVYSSFFIFKLIHTICFSHFLIIILYHICIGS